MRRRLGWCAAFVGLLMVSDAPASEWMGRIHPFMLLEHRSDYNGKTVSMLCYVTQATGDYAVCPVFNNFAEPTYSDVLLALPDVADSDRMRALDRCAELKPKRLCSAAITGTIFTVPTTGSSGMKVITIDWLESDPA